MAAGRLAFNSESSNRVEFLDEQTDEEYVIRREIEALMDNAMYSDGYRHIDDIYKNKDEKSIGEQIERWKEQYVRYTG